MMNSNDEPAYHVPVLLDECIDGLNIKPDGIYVDVTFGGGGHSRKIIEKLTSGKLVGFDQDSDALDNLIDDERFIFVNHNFRFLKNFLRYHKIEKVDGILADLGVSSHHFDTAERGFSFRFDAPLDMRMNQEADLTAAKIVNTYSVEELKQVFREYGELKNAYKIATLIEKRRQAVEIETINDLLDAIFDATPKKGDWKFLAKVFQALRMEVNSEIEVLKAFLENSLQVLKPGGRLVVISYHSLEDRLIKNFVRNGKFAGQAEKDIYGNVDVPFRAINKKVIIPTDQEIEQNNKARSAKLRIAEKN